MTNASDKGYNEGRLAFRRYFAKYGPNVKQNDPRMPPNPYVGYYGVLWLNMARVYGERKRNFVGQHFWARGFFVNTVGRDEEAIRAYIRNQEKEDQRLEQMNLWR